MSRSGGFTLIELLVAVALLAIVIGLAVPSFIGIINGNRLASGVNEMVAAVQTARMEAVRQNRRVAVCRSADNATCSAGAQWQSWITIIDSSGNGAFGAGDTVLRVSNAEAPVQVTVGNTISANNNSIVFRPDGLAYDANNALLVGAVTVCIPTDKPAMNRRILNVAAGSRVSTSQANGAGACP
ncbi:GspH/FimT family pseudopilin [Marilutibacter chinensis]|uniref:Type II secretion system protein H n=1 Tax=Marilutibacter chinensis TaxID=2912247 RepID=A0ABS9HTZ1_9GAMM|nr:GspH/FimT family pseudopilin [Lysobacter chinensis]MCF7222351.1 GspH/FimT family pseudopilin [Lysobacter chinensis]